MSVADIEQIESPNSHCIRVVISSIFFSMYCAFLSKGALFREEREEEVIKLLSGGLSALQSLYRQARKSASLIGL